MKTPREIAEQIVYRPDPNTSTSRLIEVAIINAVKAEREACVQITEKSKVSGRFSEADAHNQACSIIAEAIRERDA